VALTSTRGDSMKNLSWSDIEAAADHINSNIRRFLPNWIIGLSRGGLPLAVMLSHRMSVPMLSMAVQLRDGEGVDPIDEIVRISHKIRKNERVLIVDDINDSGATLDLICNNWPRSLRRPLFATVVERSSSPFAVDCTFITEDTGVWYGFPWEKRNEGI
jgi:hypoxanthine phosphoribosyltransferase